MKRRNDFDERQFSRPPETFEGTPMGAIPEIRTPVQSAPGSATSREGAESVDDPMRARLHRLLMLALASASRPLSREELSERTGVKESSLCGRIDDLRPDWIEAIDGACVARSGKRVDGYQLSARGRGRMRGAA